jgi:ABC-type transporter Mla subunit MlaD
MPTQDLTPQLRTRLSRLEKAVGWFVTLAALLMLAGLAFYIYNLAKEKGWYITKAPYYTYLETAAGVKEGDKVRLLGKEVGQITKVETMPPDDRENNIIVEFEVFAPHFGYIWDDSVVKVRSAGLLGTRYLEITKGGTRSTNKLHATYKHDVAGKLTQMFDRDQGDLIPWTSGKRVWLPVDEPPELTSQLDQTVAMLQISLTNILQLTNSLARTLTNVMEITANANELLRNAKPIVANAAEITENLKNPRGSLGEWVIPIAMNYQITRLLTNANLTVANVDSTVTNANTNLVAVFSNITASLENLAAITGNLNEQVQKNNNIVSSVSHLIIDTDDMVQGLKKHWLLRSAFKNKEPKEEKPKERAPTGREKARPTDTKGSRSN